MIIGKAAQSETWAKWYVDVRDAFAAQEERRSSWRRAKRGGVVPMVEGVASYLERVPPFKKSMMTLL